LAVGRSLVADPDFIGKYQGKISGNIRPCLACAEGCLGGVKQGKGLGCVVNPLVNTSLSAPLANSKKQRVAVVGGGLAGMQSALTLAERGFQVDLFEKNKLGGQFNLAWLPPKKESLKELVTYFIQELSRLKVNIIYADARVTDIENEKYSGVIMATGAHPAVPPIEGLKEFYWTEFLEDDQLPDHKKVLVIGGGMIGMEVASKLVDGNNQVVIVELLDEMAAGMEMLERNMTLAKLKTFNTSFYTGYRVAKINNGSAIIASDKDEVVIDHIDKIVVATGMRSYRPFAPSETMVVSYVGDALEPGNAQKAIHTAYELAGKFLTT
jgi:pyruvate/2-oxoglutarate dehydrogenase complex dihydrolipoamide dehydrogenase (E3) component